MTAETEGGHGPAPAPRLPLSSVVKQVEQAVRQDLDGAARAAGITVLQATALTALASRPGMTSAELGRASFTSPQASNEMVTALERKGLITREQSEHGGRARRVVLTPIGRAALEQFGTAVHDVETRMVADFSATERAAFRALLERSLASLRPDLATYQDP